MTTLVALSEQNDRAVARLRSPADGTEAPTEESDHSSRRPKIGLTLSGGGVRAAVFHLGVLRRLAAQGLFESVATISTVSGGSLVMAAVMSGAGMKWPSSATFNAEIFPELRRIMTTRDLFSFGAVGWRGLAKFNLSLLTRRAQVLAELLEQQWGISGHVAELPDVPAWFINSTCVETGKNWRFSKREMGDWQFGRHFSPTISLAQAAAASAAVPYAIGALRFEIPPEGWWETNPVTRQPTKPKIPTATVVRLWDGGAYENLGLEPLYKIGHPQQACDFLVCSDASGPLLPPGTSPIAALLKGHLSSPRLFDVASDQIRSLRSRILMADIAAGNIKGVLLRMGNSVRSVDVKSDRTRPVGFYDAFQTDEQAAMALQYPTDLKALSDAQFAALARHGFEVADVTMTIHAPAGFPQSIQWEDLA
jgi:NTE family protein